MLNRHGTAFQLHIVQKKTGENGLLVVDDCNFHMYAGTSAKYVGMQPFMAVTLPRMACGPTESALSLPPLPRQTDLRDPRKAVDPLRRTTRSVRSQDATHSLRDVRDWHRYGAMPETVRTYDATRLLPNPRQCHTIWYNALATQSPALACRMVLRSSYTITDTFIPHDATRPLHTLRH